MQRALRQTDRRLRLKRNADRPARAGATAAGRRRQFLSADCCSQIRGRTMELGIGANADVGFAWSGGGDGAGAGRAQPATGSSPTIANSAAPTVVALSLARSALRSCGSERSAEFGRVDHAGCPHARARGRRRFQRALTPTDLHRPAGRRCGCWPTSTFLFSGIVVGRFRGRTLELGIGADADVGFAWSGGGDGAGAGRGQRGTGSIVPTGPNSAALT